MLFFFASDDEEQIWGDGAPEDSVRAIYAPAVAADQPEREPPPALPPIGHQDLGGHIQNCMASQRGRCQARTALPCMPHGRLSHSGSNSSRITQQPSKRRSFVTSSRAASDLPKLMKYRQENGAGAQAPVPDGYEEARTALNVIGPLYERRVEALRVAAAMAATALPTRTGRTPVWGERADDRRR